MTSLGLPAHATGHEQAKERPALIVSADFVNRSASDVVIVLPLTSTLRSIRSHVVIAPPEGGVTEVSSIQCEQIRAISAHRLRDYLGEASEETMSQVEHTLKLLLDFT